jgi:hypothetical protein
MLKRPVGFRTEKGCAGDAKQKRKLQTRHLVSKGTPNQQICNSLKIIEEGKKKTFRWSQVGA